MAGSDGHYHRKTNEIVGALPYCVFSAAAGAGYAVV